MSLRTRLEALERQLGGEVLIVRCPRCGGPSRKGKMVVVLRDGEALERCAECGEPVEDGKALGWLDDRGQVWLKVVILELDGA